MADYKVNYDDERFTQVESDKKEALSNLEQTYGGMINESDKYYQAQIDASKQWADKQSQLQQEKTDFAIEQVEQQKAQAQKDYTKEQSGAYVDWQKQSNPYGANAEKMAASGLQNDGFSESSQVSMYNTYQNRVASARESYNLAVLNYNNAIKDARIQNNAALAEIAYQALQQQLELSLQGFQYKNNLILEQANKKQELENTYYNRYLDVLNQINSENALAEEVRQYNESMALQKAQLEEEKRQYNETMAYNKSKSSGSGGGGGGGYQTGGGGYQTGNQTGNNSTKTSFEKAVMSLGMGPLTGEAVDKLEAQGKVKMSYSEDKGWTATKTKDTKTAAQNILDNYNLFGKVTGKTGGGGKKF